MRQASRRARRVMGRGAEASASNLTESIPKNLKTAQNRPMDIPCNLMAKRPCPHLRADPFNRIFFSEVVSYLQFWTISRK